MCASFGEVARAGRQVLDTELVSLPLEAEDRSGPGSPLALGLHELKLWRHLCSRGCLADHLVTVVRVRHGSCEVNADQA